MSDALLLVLAAAAAYRVWRFYALDDLPPVAALRERAMGWVADHHGADWAQGLACVWCSGFWASCAVVGAVWALHPLPMPGLWFPAVSAVVGLLGMTLEH